MYQGSALAVGSKCVGPSERGIVWHPREAPLGPVKWRAGCGLPMLHLGETFVGCPHCLRIDICNSETERDAFACIERHQAEALEDEREGERGRNASECMRRHQAVALAPVYVYATPPPTLRVE
jgi:hypothetical protein